MFTEGWRPGVAARLGVGYDDVRAVNPSIVYCSLSGYGQTGPLAATPGHDLNYQARAGALVDRGTSDADPPRIPVLPVADLAGATVLALVVSAAWARRLQTGAGEYVDVSMTDVVASWRGGSSATKVAGRAEPMRGSAGYGVFRCADGAWLTLGVIAEDHFWAAVCDTLALDDVRDVAYAQRLSRVEALNERVADALARMQSSDTLAALERVGAPVAPTLTPETAQQPDGFPARGPRTINHAHDARARVRRTPRAALARLKSR